jgi:phosphatidylglycerol:prolipoprotein diacylglycerol transferase
MSRAPALSNYCVVRRCALITPKRDKKMMNLLGVLPYWTFGPWPKEPFMVDFIPFLNSIPLQVHSFGLMVAIGLLLGFSYMSWRAERKEGLSGERVQNFGMFLLVIGWPLSHVFNVIFYEPQLLAEDPMELFRVWGSISSYGGLFGGILAYFIWCYRNQDVERLKWGDVAITGIMLPWLFGRIGCASVHDHPGALAPDWFLAIDFPARINMAAGPRHDLGLYEAMWWVVIFAVMVWLDRKPRPRGFFIAVLPVLYAPARFTFDFFRVPQDMGGDIRYLGLTPAQYFSIGVFIAGCVVAYRIRKNKPVEWVSYKPEGSEGEDEGSEEAEEKKED